MKNEINAIKEGFKHSYNFSGLLHLYTSSVNMLEDEYRIDVLMFVYNILIVVERIADLMTVDDPCRGCDIEICEQLSEMAGRKAKEVIKKIDNINAYPPFPTNSLRDFLREYKSMDAHIQSIKEE